jgi:hypothetical protein
MDTIERPISEFTKKCLSKWWGKVGNSVVMVLPVVVMVLPVVVMVLPVVVMVLPVVVMVLPNAGLSRNTKYTILCDFSVNSQIPQ